MKHFPMILAQIMLNEIDAPRPDLGAANGIFIFENNGLSEFSIHL